MSSRFSTVPRALVVDDEEPVRVLVGRALAEQQIACDFAHDGSSAREQLDRAQYDIVVTDLRMPNGNGHLLCQSILAVPDRPLLVAITAIAEPRLRSDLESRGVDAIFEKPFDFLDFAKQIRTMFDERRDSRSRRVESGSISGSALMTDATPADGLRLPTVAILVGQPQRASALASELRTTPLNVFVAESTDCLWRDVERSHVDVLVIEDGQYGFLKAAEVLSRLQVLPSPPRAIVIGNDETFTSDQIQSLRIEKIYPRGSSNSDLVQALRSTIVHSERTRMISPEARALVKSFGLPHSPAVILKLTEYLELTPVEIPISELARDIMADPATTADFLRLANASGLAMRCQITKVADGLKYFGPRRAVLLLLSSSIRNIERSLFRKIPVELRTWYQLRTLLIASVSSAFAERHFELSADTAFVLGLFQDMGILVLAQAFGDRYLKVVGRARTIGPIRLHGAEQETFRVSHPEVSAALIEHWSLPEKLIRPIRRHHDSGLFADCLNDSSAFIRPMRIGEAFADFWDNRHPTRNDLISQLLADCRHAQCSDYRESLAQAVSRAAEFAALFRVCPPEETAALAVCKDILSRYTELDSARSLQSV